MKLTIVSPTKAYLDSYTDLELESLRASLSYTNTANAQALKRLYNNHWFKNGNKRGWEKAVEELKAKVHNCLLFQDDGGYYIRPGSIPYLDISESDVTNKIDYPPFKKVPWAKMIPFELYNYQKESIRKLLEVKHGNVELATGTGKTVTLMSIYRETGRKTAIVVPSASIFNEMLHKCEEHFGKGKVGAFGDGKKRLDKNLTVCIGDSLVNVKPGTKEWEFFTSMEAVIFDESHVLGAETLEAVCHGVFSDVPYRFFLSGTQSRGDGGKKLLESIIGPTVHTLSTAEAVRAGYVCDHEFRIVKIESSNPNFNSPDPLAQKRAHFLRNRNIAAFAAKLANAKAMSTGEQTLILVDELVQIAMLVPLLKVPFAYAHSEVSKKKLEDLERETGVLLEKVDSSESVEKFNKNEVKVLIGTGCISTGTNIYSMTSTINWQGGSSLVKTKQGSVGRSVRLHKANPWKDQCFVKTKCIIYDFDVEDVYVLKAHLEDRIEYYKDSGVDIKFIKLK